MKTKLLLSALLSFIFCLLSSQVPQGFNYQAIARDGSGTILANLALPVKIDIQTSLTGGTLIYEELFASVTSNQFGLISLVVGTGTWQAGSAPSFSAINWKAQTLFLKTIIQYPGTTWTTMGTSQIWATPYSLVAKDVEGPIAKLGITGTTDDMEDALFEVKNKTGQTVFAVYNEGIRAYVGNGNAKGAKGGFSVGGYDATKGAPYDLFVLNTDSARFYIDSKPNLKGKRGGFSVGGYDMTKGVPFHDYLDVSKDSVRIYVDSNPATKGARGGFSVGGYDMTKGGIPAQDYMHVSKDSVRVYIDSNPATKGKRGGFAVGGYDLTKGGVTINKFLAVNPDSTRIVTSDTIKGFGVSNLSSGNTLGYLRLTPSNYFIGHEAGKKVTLAKYNSVMGYQAGSSLTTGEANEFIGYQAGMKDTTGSYNIFLGYQAGYNSPNALFNTSLGYQAGYNARSNDERLEGSANVLIGYQAGYNVLTGLRNVMIGPVAGFNHQVAEGCVFIGFGAGSGDNYDAPPIAKENNFIGYYAGKYVKLGDDNVFIGGHAGANCDNAASSVIIGGMANSANFASDPSNTNNNVYIGYSAARVNPGNNNVIIGKDAGNNSVGSNNVFIGNQAGYSETGSNKLYIDNSSTSSPLIYGDFTDGSEKLVINGNLGIGIASPTQKLDVNGNARFSSIGSGAYVGAVNRTSDGTLTTATSDIRSKENINTLTGCLNSVLNIRGVSFYWKSEPRMGRRIGFVAQEVEQVIPELVFTNPSDGLKGVNYPEMSAVLVEAIKEQQQEIESYKSEIQSLQDKVKKIESQQKEIDELKTIVSKLIANQTAQVNK
jgi:hypothetical protein